MRARRTKIPRTDASAELESLGLGDPKTILPGGLSRIEELGPEGIKLRFVQALGKYVGGIHVSGDE